MGRSPQERNARPAPTHPQRATALSADNKGHAARQAADDRIDLGKALAGLVPGKPQSCIDPRRYRDSTRVGDKIVYRAGRRDVFVTDTGGERAGLRRGDAIVTKSFRGSCAAATSSGPST